MDLVHFGYLPSTASVIMLNIQEKVLPLDAANVRWTIRIRSSSKSVLAYTCRLHLLFWLFWNKLKLSDLNLPIRNDCIIVSILYWKAIDCSAKWCTETLWSSFRSLPSNNLAIFESIQVARRLKRICLSKIDCRNCVNIWTWIRLVEETENSHFVGL